MDNWSDPTGLFLHYSLGTFIQFSTVGIKTEIPAMCLILCACRWAASNFRVTFDPFIVKRNLFRTWLKKKKKLQQTKPAVKQPNTEWTIWTADIPFRVLTQGRKPTFVIPRHQFKKKINSPPIHIPFCCQSMLDSHLAEIPPCSFASLPIFYLLWQPSRAQLPI